MGLIFSIVSLFSGLSDFFKLLRDSFAALPFAIQCVIYLSFGGLLLFCLLKMLVSKG